MADNAPPGKGQWRQLRRVLATIAGIGGAVGLVQLGVSGFAVLSGTVQLEADAFVQAVRIIYFFSLLALAVAIWLTPSRWLRAASVLMLVVVAVGFPSLVHRFESGLGHDESEFNFEQNAQGWTVSVLDFGYSLGSEPFVSAEQAFAGRQSLAFDVSLWGVNKLEQSGIAQLELADYLPLPGSMLIGHVYLPPDAPDNVLVRFLLLEEGEELLLSDPVRACGGRWVPVLWAAPSRDLAATGARLALQFYLGRPGAAGSRAENQWEGRVFVDSIEVICPLSTVATITPTPVIPTGTVTATATPIPIPTPTSTATPTVMLPTPTQTPRATVPPTSTPAPEPAPVLVSPADGEVHRGETAIPLEWSWTTRELRPDEFFALRVWPADQAEPGDIVAWVQESTYYLDVSRFEPGAYKWNVAVIEALEEEPFWEALSYDSSTWTFEVRPPDVHPTEPSPEPTPTPR